jgi:energy-coupling factor transporter transmembrane protein EcfT
MGALIGFLGLAGLVVAVVLLVVRVFFKKGLGYKNIGVLAGVALTLFIVGLIITPSTKESFNAGREAGQQAVQQTQEPKKNEATDEVIYEVTGELDIKFKDDKVIATISTNAVDGSIFETAIMDGNFNMVSDFITIQNGVGVKEFDIPKEWEVGYISGSAMMRFNLDEHP